MGLFDVIFADAVDRDCDDEVFVDDSEDEGFEEDSFLSSGSSTPSTSTSSDDDEADQSSNIIRLVSSRSDADAVELCRVRLGLRLGAGGFGRVFEGELDCADQRRRVAVKVARRRSGSSGFEASTDSFLAESAIAHLSHPNVVGVLAAGWIAEQPDDCPWSTEAGCYGMAVDMVPAIVMEFAGHHNLQSIIDDSSQSLSLRRRLRYASDMTSALTYIHQRCIVHLDVKPANVIVTDSDRCKLVDFGCSQRLQSMVDDDVEEDSSRPVSRRPTNTPRRPGTPTFNGTFAYRAPELLRSGPVTPAADVYSLGMTLWQLRSRSMPYAGRDWHAVVFAVVAYHDRPDTSPALRRCRRRQSTAAHRPPTSPSPVTRTPEHRYRNVYRRCWDAEVAARPSADELMRLFEAWTTELDDASSTSSVDLNDV